ncbi:MAG: pyrroline-5-carboxylate reductase [Phycisphaerales bacterium]|nr:pyrroline-5-carboxylate reductase [Phycisphaerales bacterium]
MNTIDQPILFVGGGNMAYAIISGAIHAKSIQKESVGVIEPQTNRHELFDNVFTSIQDASGWLDAFDKPAVIVLAVKPQMLQEVSKSIGELLESLSYTPMVISILAGIKIDKIESSIQSISHIIRVMPNTPAQIGQAMSALAASSETTDLEINLATQLFSSIGQTIHIPEDLMDPFTAIAGSGPAYLFYLAEGMIEAARQLGFDKHQSQIIVRQTLLGSSMLLDRSPDLPGSLRTRVTSKNGTTEAATNTLDESGTMDAIVRAIHAARHRGAELGKM